MSTRDLLFSRKRTSGPPTPVDPQFNKVELLLHGDGVDNGIMFPDSSSRGRTVDLTARQEIVTDTGLKKFGTAALSFPYIPSIPYQALQFPYSDGGFDFGLGDFTLELQFQSFGPQPQVNEGHLFFVGSFNQGRSWSIVLLNTVILLIVYNGTTQTRLFTSAGIAYNQWHYLTVSRVGGQLWASVDSAAIVSNIPANIDMTPTNKTVSVGSVKNTSSGHYPFRGSLDEIRVTKGYGRYNAIPPSPTGAFPDA